MLFSAFTTLGAMAHGISDGHYSLRRGLIVGCSYFSRVVWPTQNAQTPSSTGASIEFMRAKSGPVRSRTVKFYSWLREWPPVFLSCIFLAAATWTACVANRPGRSWSGNDGGSNWVLTYGDLE